MNLAKLSELFNPDAKLPGREIHKWGYRECSETDYRQFPAINNSLLKCPTLAEAWAMLSCEKRDTAALQLGNLADMVVLTPDEPWTERFALAPIPTNPTTGKAYAADSEKARAAVEGARRANPGKSIVSEDGMMALASEARGIKQAVFNSALCSDMVTGPNVLKQVSGFLFHPVWKCWTKWKVDILPLRPDPAWTLADMKTTRRHVQQFEKDCFEFGYFDQAGWYAHLHETLLGSRGLPIKVEYFDFLVVSKADPDARNPRPVMARKIRVPLNPEVNLHMSGFHRRIFPEDGMGRVELFLAAAREHLATNPDLANPLEISRIWTAYEHESEPFMLARVPHN